ncbi:hypothetical protein PVAP13_7KG428701 [Panicum virgatum]|uniref:Uncharacterized protein n=1 Tax=Panicum virgatum TaxID=38727 RepID=A0A8T0QQG4_PANVG|nr:hypothetical protein PVAP13_7KG428701 [Panicum virgatum]
MELHDTAHTPAHTPAMRTAPTRRSTSSPRPQLLRRLLAMVFGEGSAAARARWSSSVAAELRRPALRPLRLPPPVPFHGRAGQIRQPRARPVAAAAGSGGLDVRLRRWWRPPRAPWRLDLARPPPPFLAGDHDGCPREAMAGSRSLASGAVERRRRLLQVRWRSRSGGGRRGAGLRARGTAV